MMFKHKLQYELNLTPEEAVSRLKINVRTSFWSMFTEMYGESYLRGVFTRSYFYIAYSPKWYRNSFSPVFYGKIVKTRYGSKLVGFFTLHWSVWIFLAIWNVFFVIHGPKGWLFNLACFLLIWFAWDKTGIMKIKNLFEAVLVSQAKEIG